MTQHIYAIVIIKLLFMSFIIVFVDTKRDSNYFQLIEVVRQRTNQFLNIVNPTRNHHRWLKMARQRRAWVF